MHRWHPQCLLYAVRRCLAGGTGDGLQTTCDLHTGQRKRHKPESQRMEMRGTGWRLAVDRKAQTGGRPIPSADENSVGEGDELMERLTQRLRTGEVLMASDYEEKYTEQEWISVLQDRIAAYEDTGLTPGDIKELLDVAVSKTNKVLRLKEELHAMKNELCQYCGKYKQAHEGACDGCKWRGM